METDTSTEHQTEEAYWFNLIDCVISLTDARKDKNDLNRLKSLQSLLNLYIGRIEAIREEKNND